MALIARLIPQGNNKPPVNYPLTTKEPLRLKGARGDVVLVLDEKTEKPVETVEVKQIDKEIHLTTSVGAEKAVLILEDADGSGISVSDDAGKYVHSSSTDVQVSTARSGFLIGDEGVGWLPWAAALLAAALIPRDKDTTPPVTGSLDITAATDSGANDMSTKNGNPVLEFTGEAGLVITLKGADGSLLTKDTQYTVSYASGKYTVTLLDAVPGGSAQPFGTFLDGVPTNNSFATADGLYTIVATDGAGNQANVGQFVIDTTKPVVGDFDMAAPTDTAGLSVDDENTSNGLPVLTFQGEAGLSVVLTGASGTALTKDTHYSVSYSNGTYTVTLLDAQPGGSADPFGTATNGSGNTGDGTYTLSVKDAADNTAEVGTFVIDTTAPTVPTVVAQSSNDTTPTVTGTATVGAGETLSVEINGVTYTAANGLSYNGTTWSVTVPTALTADTYSVTARVTDIAGNTSVDTTSSELVIDTTAPVTNPLNITTATDTGADDLSTKNGNPVLEFTGEAGLVITLKGADGSLLTKDTQYTVSYASGKYTVTLLDAVPGGSVQPFGTFLDGVPTGNTAATADGTYTIVATDTVGNSGNVGQFVIDTTEPVVGDFDMAAPTDTAGLSVDDENTSNGLPVLTFQGEAGLSVVLTGASGTALTKDTHYSVSYSNGTYTVTLLDAQPGGSADPFGTATNGSGNTGDGTYTLSVKDAADNTAEVGTFVIDTTAPTVPTVVAQSSNDTTPTVTGTATVGAGETLSVEINGVTYTAANGLSYNGTTWSVTVPTALTADTYSVTARVTDIAGNTSVDTTSSELVIDTTAPVTNPLNITTATDTGADDLSTKNGNPVLEFTGEAGLVITLKGADGSLLTKDTQYTVSYASGKYTVTLLDAVPGGSVQPFGTFLDGVPTGNTAATADGTYTIVAADTAGNSNTVGTFTIDTTAPSAPTVTNVTENAGDPNTMDLLTNDNTQVLTVTGETGGVLKVYTQAGALIPTSNYTVTETAGIYTVNFGTNTLNDGDYVVKITDSAGNESGASGAFTVDTTAPTGSVTVTTLSTNDSTPVIGGTVTGMTAGDTLLVTVGTGTYLVTPVSGDWSLDLGTEVPVSGIAPALVPGNYDVVASIMDAAGNKTYDTSFYELTITAPASADLSVISTVYVNDYRYFRDVAGDSLTQRTGVSGGTILVQFSQSVRTGTSDTEPSAISWDYDGGTVVDGTGSYNFGAGLTGQQSGLPDRLLFTFTNGGGVQELLEAGLATPNDFAGAVGDTMDFAAGVAKTLVAGTASVATDDIEIQYYWKMADAGGSFIASNLADKLVGGTGADIFDGRGGNDEITLGAGADTLIFSSTTGSDLVTDYSVAADTINLLQSVFGGFTSTGAVAANQFVSGAGLTSASTADQRLIYNTTDSKLYYDADGVNGSAAVLLATFTGAPVLANTEFFVV